MPDDIKPSTCITAEDYKVWVIQKILEKLVASIPPELMVELVTKDSGPWLEIKVSSKVGGIYVSTDFGSRPKSSIILSGGN